MRRYVTVVKQGGKHFVTQGPDIGYDHQRELFKGEVLKPSPGVEEIQICELVKVKRFAFKPSAIPQPVVEPKKKHSK